MKLIAFDYLYSFNMILYVNFDIVNLVIVKL